ncbi:MAG: hypothetical protein EA398_02775 [Deltaproteobacteria bacterium]|nr:MAG: hypothetical protein EA398_02775 [Deltaproteobacteria bacterium]
MRLPACPSLPHAPIGSPSRAEPPAPTGIGSHQAIATTRRPSASGGRKPGAPGRAALRWLLLAALLLPAGVLHARDIHAPAPAEVQSPQHPASPQAPAVDIRAQDPAPPTRLTAEQRWANRMESTGMRGGIGTWSIAGISLVLHPNGVVDHETRSGREIVGAPEAGDPERRWLGDLRVDGAVLLPGSFTGRAGAEAEVSLGLPARSWMGNFSGSLGVLVEPLRLPLVRASAGFGAGRTRAHTFGYVQPRGALALGDQLALEAAWRWIPPYASRFARREGMLRDGLEHHRLRLSLLFYREPIRDLEDWADAVSGGPGFRIFAELHRFRGIDSQLERGNVEDATTIAFGGGIVF